ncbi:uncharacterized protein LOC144283713 isoform X2 [Canis aureus]
MKTSSLWPSLGSTWDKPGDQGTSVFPDGQTGSLRSLPAHHSWGGVPGPTLPVTSLHSVLQNVWLALIPGTKERPFTFHISQMRPRRHSHICAQVCMCVYVFVTDKVRKLRHSELKQLVRSHNLVSGCAGFEQRHSGKARAGYNILRRRPNIPSRLLVCCLLLSC